MRKLRVTAIFLSLTIGLAGGQTRRSTGKAAPRPLTCLAYYSDGSPQEQHPDSRRRRFAPAPRRISHAWRAIRRAPLDVTNVDPLTKPAQHELLRLLRSTLADAQRRRATFVVLGTARNFAQFLTPDRRHIYAELTLTPVHFSRVLRRLHPSLSVKRGSLKLPNHRVAYDPPPSGHTLCPWLSVRSVS